VSTAPASAATVGETFDPSGSACTNNRTWLQTTSAGDLYRIPFDGLITSWRFQAGVIVPNTLKLKVGHVVSGQMTITAEGPVSGVGSGLSTYIVHIPVLAGDVIGFYFPPPGTPPCNGSGSGTVEVAVGDVAPGATAPTATIVGTRLDIAANLEHDCDGDGFGDETQDPNTLSCPPGPSARITHRPRNKIETNKKRVRSHFIFDSPDDNDANVTFQCTLDGKQEFMPCTSPLAVSVKKGKHTFSVTATDAGGNTGAAATDSFKVKRKKKK
jgi:hypothetical protein